MESAACVRRCSMLKWLSLEAGTVLQGPWWLSSWRDAGSWLMAAAVGGAWGMTGCLGAVVASGLRKRVVLVRKVSQ